MAVVDGLVPEPETAHFDTESANNDGQVAAALAMLRQMNDRPGQRFRRTVARQAGLSTSIVMGEFGGRDGVHARNLLASAPALPQAHARGPAGTRAEEWREAEQRSAIEHLRRRGQAAGFLNASRPDPHTFTLAVVWPLNTNPDEGARPPRTTHSLSTSCARHHRSSVAPSFLRRPQRMRGTLPRPCCQRLPDFHHPSPPVSPVGLLRPHPPAR